MTIAAAPDLAVRERSQRHSRADETGKTSRVAPGYTPFPKPKEFHASRVKYRLFGGAAGPGNSKALLMEAILQAHEVPGANTLLLRRPFSELEQSLLLYFRRDIPRALYKSYNESKRAAHLRNLGITVGCRYRLQGAFDGAAGDAGAVGAFDLRRRSD